MLPWFNDEDVALLKMAFERYEEVNEEAVQNGIYSPSTWYIRKRTLIRFIEWLEGQWDPRNGRQQRERWMENRSDELTSGVKMRISTTIWRNQPSFYDPPIELGEVYTEVGPWGKVMATTLEAAPDSSLF